MKRRKFILASLAAYPVSLIASIKSRFSLRTDKGFKVSAGEARFGKHYHMKGVTANVLDIKISSKDTDDGIAVFEQTGLSHKGGPPLHVHPFQDEWFYVTKGRYFFQVGEETFHLKKGDTIFLPKNVKHAFIQLSRKGKMIVTYLPAGKMEGFFKVTSEWDTPPNKAEIARVFEEHGMKVVGPPLKLSN